MYVFDFLSKYKRFHDGKASAPDFAHWLIAHNDEMQSELDDASWASFVGAQHLAAEFTGDHSDQPAFRFQLDHLWSSAILPLAQTAQAPSRQATRGFAVKLTPPDRPSDPWRRPR